jgi:hypothetical protein
MMSPSVFRFFVLLAFLLLLSLPAFPQVTLTGAVWFATTPTGGTSVQQAYADGASNTLGGDQWWNLWLALDPNATSPVNGPSDAQSSISIPLLAGNTYKYYMFAQGPCCTLSYSGLNLFFKGNNTTPAISVFGVVGSTGFQPNGNGNTFTLEVSPAAGAGTGFYSANGVTIVLTTYDWMASGTLDVCQAFTFSPGGDPSSQGSFTLRVFPAAALSSSVSSSTPGRETALIGSGFSPLESVALYFGGLDSAPIATATADSSGSFAIAARVPEHPYGPSDVYAHGEASGALGATSIHVTPGLPIAPRRGTPGSMATVRGSGFGAGESVTVYWGNPRESLGSAQANTSGDFIGSAAFSFALPADAPRGSNAIVAIGKTTGAIAVGEIDVE